MKLITCNDTQQYRLYQIDYVVENKKQLLKECYDSIERFNIMFPQKSTTWSYRSYNTFNLTSGSVLFYNLFNDLKSIIRNYQGNNDPLWMQSWINLHEQHEVLDWHNHVDTNFHGYISIEPFNTKTIFNGYEIKNETGLAYIGPSYKKHKVIVNEPFIDKRITIAFDVVGVAEMEGFFKTNGNDINLSFLPI